MKPLFYGIILLCTTAVNTGAAHASSTDTGYVFIAQKKYGKSANALFYYSLYTHMAYHPDGRVEYIPIDSIQKVNVQLPKLSYPDKFFRFEDENNELLVFAKREKVDIDGLIKSALNKDGKALYALFDLYDSVDGAAAEGFVVYFWGIITRWTDEELVQFIRGLYPSQRTAFLNYLSNNDNTFPIERPMEYYKIYYPSLYAQIATAKY